MSGAFSQRSILSVHCWNNSVLLWWKDFLPLDLHTTGEVFNTVLCVISLSVSPCIFITWWQGFSDVSVIKFVSQMHFMVMLLLNIHVRYLWLFKDFVMMIIPLNYTWAVKGCLVHGTVFLLYIIMYNVHLAAQFISVY